MSAFLCKYNTAVHIYIPVIKRAVVDFAVSADWTPGAGDVKISKDGGAAANVTNLPVAIAMGNGAIWDFSLTATELSAAKLNVTVADSATKAVEDQSFVIFTFGNASAQYGVDFSDATAFGLSRIDAAITSRLAPTVATRTLDVTATGGAGIDWSNVEAPTTTLDLSGTTIKTTQKVDVDTIKTNPVVNAGTVTFPTTATLASTTNITAGTVTTATNLTTNNDKTGYALSNTGMDNLLDRTDGVETGWTLRQALRLVLSSLAGKLSGAATTTVTIRNVTDTKNRIVATVDASGNRSAITTDVT